MKSEKVLLGLGALITVDLLYYGVKYLIIQKVHYLLEDVKVRHYD